MKPAGEAFREGLKFRNVLLEESPNADPRAADILALALGESVPETDEERKSHEQLWMSDRAKCNGQTNEALFQRTLMMSLIARQVFIYDRDTASKSCLDFSVEETWTCPPMPTRAYQMNGRFLTQPKPDLAVCFRRKAVIPELLWYNLPRATSHLVCYESSGDCTERVFHFFTIEAKKATIGSGDSVGKCQSLNNASQALHNMYEFFKDAGPQHEDIFFAKVRFFSVVASNGGLTIRIHRATREIGSDRGFIMRDRPDYPLRFEYQDILTIERSNFDRKIVLETFRKILIGYGATELRGLLSDAAKSLMEKLNDESEAAARQHPDFYRYGQTTITTGSRKPTPAANSRRWTPTVIRDQSVQMSRATSETTTSFDMARSDPTTPTLSRPLLSTQAPLNYPRKRRREELVDSVPAKSTRQRNE